MGSDPLAGLPLAVFPGRIHLVLNETAAIRARLVIRRERVVGLDTESRPSFRKGELFPIALVQIATGEDAFLFRVRAGAPFRALKRVVEDASITKIVQGVAEEIRELRRDLGIEARGFVDLPTVARAAGYRSLNLRALAAEALGIRISKSAQRSDWSRPDLSRQQIEYAATDAWACLAVYQRIQGGKETPALSGPAERTATVRAARRRDAGVLASLIQEVEGAEPAGADARSVRRWLGTRGCGILVAELGGRAVGLLSWVHEPGLFRRAAALKIEEIAVGRAARGQGVGQALLATAVELGRERGCGVISVTTARDDRSAHTLYRDAGLRDESVLLSRRFD